MWTVSYGTKPWLFFTGDLFKNVVVVVVSIISMHAQLYNLRIPLPTTHVKCCTLRSISSFSFMVTYTMVAMVTENES